MGSINWKDKCWVATVYLVNNDEKVLLTWNKNLQTWIPVGGHIDPGETPEEAIKREVAKETGFDFEFISPHNAKTLGKNRILKSHIVQIEEIPHHNMHMNFIFFGKCTSWSKEKEETDEQEKLRWFSKEEILNEKSSFLPNVYEQSLEALNLT